MTHYNPNSPLDIQSLFAGEGDKLRRAGFQEPDLSEKPEDFGPRTLEGAGVTITPIESAWDEAARLGMDPETFLEG
jgi:hypothetical protein